jgi:hypothetical protein
MRRARSRAADGDGLLTVAVEHGRRDMLGLLLDLGLNADERKGADSGGAPLARRRQGRHRDG